MYNFTTVRPIISNCKSQIADEINVQTEVAKFISTNPEQNVAE